MRRSILAVASILVLGLAIAPIATNAASSDRSTVTVKLTPVGDSKITGSADISELIVVPENPPAISLSIKLEGQFIPEDKWPVDIHAGACGHMDPKVAFALTPAVEGSSVTHVENVTVAKLLRAPRYSIEVHNPKDTAVVSCGFIDVPR